jgi:hypothetical protein
MHSLFLTQQAPAPATLASSSSLAGAGAVIKPDKLKPKSYDEIRQRVEEELRQQHQPPPQRLQPGGRRR